MEVRREVEFQAPPSDVWEALTDPERLGEWFANAVELDVRPGGEGSFRWDDGTVRHARVEAVEYERRLAFRWRDADADTPATAVEITLAETAEGTRLTVVETAPFGPTALAGEWSWGLELLASLPRLRRLAHA